MSSGLKLDLPQTYSGKLTFISGEGKHSGKTTFMNRALDLSRRRTGQDHLGLLVMTTGLDGEASDSLSSRQKPLVHIEEGDYFLTAEKPFSQCRAAAEIVEVFPGAGAMGRRILARAGRAAKVILVGPEGNAGMTRVLEMTRDERLADTVFVDGAINRITQIFSMGDSQFVYTMIIEGHERERAIANLKKLWMLQNLPLEKSSAQDEKSVFRMRDVLTVETVQTIPADTEAVSVEDFTRVFLDAAGLESFLKRRDLFVRRRTQFLGFSLVLKALEKNYILENCSEFSQYISFNPYESEGGAA